MTRIDRTAELAALNACGVKAMAARNGHGARWAREQGARDLQAAGHAADDAQQLAESMARFSTGFAARADVLQAEFNAGRIDQLDRRL